MPAKLNFEAFKKLNEDPKNETVFDLIQYICRSSYKGSIDVTIKPLKKLPQLYELFENKKTIWPLNLDYLKNLSEDSLGYQYVLYLERNHLQSQYSSYKPNISNFRKYVKYRLLESHVHVQPILNSEHITLHL